MKHFGNNISENIFIKTGIFQKIHFDSTGSSHSEYNHSESTIWPNRIHFGNNISENIFSKTRIFEKIHFLNLEYYIFHDTCTLIITIHNIARIHVKLE